MTTIYQVRDNLKRTIAGKEAYLAEVKQARERLLELEGAGGRAQDSALFATQEFLKINLTELTTILAEVEVCCAKATADSWALNPERMGR